MDNNTRFSADNRFSIIPHWVIFSGISSTAIHLYAVIAKYADNNTGQAFPARTRLAEDLGKSVDTIDRTAKELVKVGALKVSRRTRRDSKENYSNLYTLITANPNAPQIPDVIEVDPDEVAAPMRLGSRTDAAVTIPTELHPTSYTGVITPQSSTSNKSDTPFTSEQSPDDAMAKSSTDQKTAIKPTPGNLGEWQRAELRDSLRLVGYTLKQGHKFHDDPVQKCWDRFNEFLRLHLGDDAYETYFEDMLVNGKWTVSAKVSDPYQAGIELNKLINTALSN